MIQLLSHGEWIPFPSPEALLDYLAPEVHSNRQEVRDMVAKKFRPVVQACAIADFPLAAIVGINEEERAILYSSDANVPSWHLLPPLVHAGDPSLAPSMVNLEDVSTVWVIDSTSDLSLLTSLRNYRAILWRDEESGVDSTT